MTNVTTHADRQPAVHEKPQPDTKDKPSSHKEPTEVAETDRMADHRKASQNTVLSRPGRDSPSPVPPAPQVDLSGPPRREYFTSTDSYLDALDDYHGYGGGYGSYDRDDY